MFVMRSRVDIIDCSAEQRFFGVGGVGAATAIAATFGRAPLAGQAVEVDARGCVVAFPHGRYVVIAAAEGAGAVWDALARHAAIGGADQWRRFGVASGVAWITAATSDAFVAQMINWDALGGVSFQKGCYPGQEVVARMRYLGRLKERLFPFHADAAPPAPGTRLFSPLFNDQPCGTVVNAATAPGRGTDFLAVVQLAALDVPGLALAAPAGPEATRLTLPYPLPDVVAPRGRIA
jgi:folate-binding protein YgfZ